MKIITDYFRSPTKPRSSKVACLFDRTGASLAPFPNTVNVRGRTERALRGLEEVDDLGIVLCFPKCPHLSPAGARWWSRKRAANPLFQEREMEELRTLERGLLSLGVAFVIVLPFSSQIRSCFVSQAFCASPHCFGGYLHDTPHPTHPEIIPPRDAFQKRMLVVHRGVPRPVERPVPAVWEYRRGKRVSPLFARRTKRHLEARKLPPMGLVTACVRVMYS